MKRPVLLSARKWYDGTGLLWRAEYDWLDERGVRHHIGIERPTETDLEKAVQALRAQYPAGIPA